MAPTPATPSEIFSAVAPLAAEPERTAIFLDLDGTLAPIVDRPEETRVPGRSRELVERIGERYALAGVVTGRKADDARRILGLDGLTYIGNHGFEVLRSGEKRAEPAPGLAEQAGRVGDFLEGIFSERLRRHELRLEDKGAIQALHWRGADDEAGAERAAAEIAGEAERAGLDVHRGRKVLELRPPVELDKGTGLTAVLAGADLACGFYAGDDRTDLDAFRALGRLVEEGALERALRVAVTADESPPELATAAELAVAGPEGFVAVLEALA